MLTARRENLLNAVRNTTKHILYFKNKHVVQNGTGTASFVDPELVFSEVLILLSAPIAW